MECRDKIILANITICSFSFLEKGALLFYKMNDEYLFVCFFVCFYTHIIIYIYIIIIIFIFIIIFIIIIIIGTLRYAWYFLVFFASNHSKTSAEISPSGRKVSPFSFAQRFCATFLFLSQIFLYFSSHKSRCVLN